METLTLLPEDRELIRSIIIADPDLVLDDDQVMRRLVGETTGSRKVVDLRDRLVERLEGRLTKLANTHRTVIAAAYENVAGTNQLHRAVLALIEPPDLASFLMRLTHEVPSLLGLEEARLCLEGDVEEIRPAEDFQRELAGRMLVLPEGAIADYLALDGNPRRVVVLRESGADSEIIFGESNPVQSEALMRLDLGGSPGLLAFGSADPRKFDPTHGTDLLNFFTGVVERLLIQHLADPDG